MMINNDDPEQEEDQWRVIIEKLPIPMLVSEGRIEKVILINRKFVETFGYDIDEVPDVHHWWPLAYPDESYRQQVADQWNDNLNRAMAEKRELDPMKVYISCRDGSVRYVEVRAYSFGDLQMVLFMDLTEIQNSREAIEKSLREKEQLMNELNHRVKNNLMLVSSLVSLKSRDSQCRQDLMDISRQIDAIRIVHEKLIGRSDVTSICLHDYVQDLLESIFSVFVIRQVDIENSIDSELLVPTKTAVSLGLIVNEAATNAVKHGFREGEAARFMVALESIPGRRMSTLVLENSGSPFPEDAVLTEKGHLGLQLIRTLAEQLDGTMQISNSPHPRLTLSLDIKSS